MTSTPTHSAEKLGPMAHIFAWLAFIPYFGFLFGVIAFFWGLITRKSDGKRVAKIAAIGLTVSLAIYGALFYMNASERSEHYAQERRQLAQVGIDLLAPAIEQYKIQQGHYPESLKALKATLAADSVVSILDPQSGIHANEYKPFFYQLVDAEHYYLRSVGPDEQPFSADDVVPQQQASNNALTGLLLEKKTP